MSEPQGELFVRRLGFTEAARFNRVLDTDAELRTGLNALAARFSDTGEEEYTSKRSLFRRVGLELIVQKSSLRRCEGLRRRTVVPDGSLTPQLCFRDLWRFLRPAGQQKLIGLLPQGERALVSSAAARSSLIRRADIRQSKNVVGAGPIMLRQPNLRPGGNLVESFFMVPVYLSSAIENFGNFLLRLAGADP